MNAACRELGGPRRPHRDTTGMGKRPAKSDKPDSLRGRRTHRKSRLTKIGGEVKQRIGYKGGLSLDTQYRHMGHTHVRMQALESVSARARACLQLVFLRCLSEYTLIYIKYACLQTSK